MPDGAWCPSPAPAAGARQGRPCSWSFGTRATPNRRALHRRAVPEQEGRSERRRRRLAPRPRHPDAPQSALPAHRARAPRRRPSPRRRRTGGSAGPPRARHRSEARGPRRPAAARPRRGCAPRTSMSWPRRTAKTGSSRPWTPCPRRSRWPSPTTKRSASETMWTSSRPWRNSLAKRGPSKCVPTDRNGWPSLPTASLLAAAGTWPWPLRFGRRIVIFGTFENRDPLDGHPVHLLGSTSLAPTGQEQPN